MTVCTRASLLLWVLLPRITLSTDVPNCPAPSRSQVDHKIANLTGPLIDIDNCNQESVVLVPNGIWRLTSTKRNPLQFVFTPHQDFEYFEVLFTLGRRSRTYNSLRVNQSLVGSGPYVVSIAFRNEAIDSTLQRIIGNLFMNPRNQPLHSNRPSHGNPRDDKESEDNFLAGLKEVTCSSESAPNGQELSNIEILAAGGSEWLYLPDLDLCPTSTTNPFEIHDNPIRASDNESTHRGRPRIHPVLRTTVSSPTYRSHQSTSSEDPWFSSGTEAPDRRIQPRLPKYDLYDRNRSSTSSPGVHRSHDDHGHDEDEHQEPHSNVTEGRDLKDASIVGDAIIASSIVGVLAVVLLAIGCCFLFRHINLQGSYGIHSNTYEPQSSIHLRDSQYNDGNDVGNSNPGHTATDVTPSAGTVPADSHQTTAPSAGNKTSASSAGGGGGGAVNQSMEDSEGTPC